ncbi:stealth conserved region 3 domain-containing protein [Spirillospora sp. NPDC047279]|uniref:stealth conserved region 3 domain-containing protein n=1 Tax=Spirillospora sp. NPDC047279 TaxID=3155478 RepID=UPI0033E59CD4
MKITYFLDGAGGEAEAVDRAAVEDAAHLAGAHDVTFLALHGPVPSWAPDTPFLIDRSGDVPRPRRRTSLDGTTLERLAADGTLADVETEAALAAFDGDVLVTSGTGVLGPAARHRPARALLVHRTDLAPERWEARHDPILAAAPRLDGLITGTRHAAEWFTASLEEAAPPVAAVPWTPPPGPRPRASLAARTVVLAGRLTNDCGAGDAIRAFATIAGRFPGWRLRIAGDGPAAKSLDRLIDALDLHHQVQITGDALSASSTAEELAAASIRLVLGPDAGAGRAYTEAFAAGVPVIARACPGAEEFVTDGVNGHLLIDEGAAALAARLASLMDDEQARLKLGTAALDRVPVRDAGFFGELLAGRAGAAARRADRAAAHAARTVKGFVPVATAQRKAAAVRRTVQARDVQVRDDLGPHDAARLNLETVAGVLREAGIPFWVLRDHGQRHRVAVRAAHRTDTIEALARSLADEPVHAHAIKPAKGGPASGLVRDTAAWPAPGGLRIFRYLATSTRTLEYGPDQGCDLEFWGEAGNGALTPLRATLIGDTVPAGALDEDELTVGGHRYPTLRAFTRTPPDEITFPIDAVFTWVDGDDPDWRARRDETLTAAGLTPSRADGGDSRYSSRDELRYSLRSLAAHAPWIRHVWIVTDRQAPAWLEPGPGVTVVDHRDLFSDPDAELPTFNSHAIETRLHHIDGLAEHFLYLNDDFFIGRPLPATRFFDAGGLTRCFPSSTTIPPGPRTDRDPTWIAAAKNNRALIEEEFGRTPVRAFKHAPYALRRSVLDEIEGRWPEALAATARSRIRSVRDVSLVSSLYHHYALCTARAVTGDLSVDTVPLSHGTGMPTLTRLLALRDRDCFCLNDMASGDLGEAEKWRAATGFMESYFPVRGPHEVVKSSEINASGGGVPVRPTGGSAPR